MFLWSASDFHLSEHYYLKLCAFTCLKTTLEVSSYINYYLIIQ